MNKTALITGAAKRVGKAMVQHLAHHGWNIALHYNTSDTEANRFCNELRCNFPQQKFETFRADLQEAKQVEGLLPRVVQEFPEINLLINNASVFEPSNLAKTTSGFMEKQLNVNFMAPFILSVSFVKLFGSGIIVNFVDTRIVKNQPNYAAYTLSKKMLWEFTKMASVEFGPGTRVNAIAPGLTLPPAEKDEKYLWDLAEKIPMKRPGGVEPILKSLDYILENDYLTGQLLFCDGGENLN